MKKHKNANHKYIVANNTDELWGLFVTTIGFQLTSPNVHYPSKDHPSAYWFDPKAGRILHEYQLIYVTKGEGIFQSAHCSPIQVSAGNIIMLFPEEWHTYQPDKKTGWEVYWVGFNGSNIDRLLDHYFFAKNQPVLDIGFYENLIGLYQQGIDVANYQKTAFQPMLAGIVQLLLGSVFYIDKNNSFRDKDVVTRIDQARVLIRENITTDKTLEQIASQLNMSYSWFRRLFKQYTGFSPAQYQLEIKIQKAKELLASTVMPIKEIAYELNFESASYFITFFKSKIGISPKTYRDKVHINPNKQGLFAVKKRYKSISEV